MDIALTIFLIVLASLGIVTLDEKRHKFENGDSE